MRSRLIRSTRKSGTRPFGSPRFRRGRSFLIAALSLGMSLGCSPSPSEPERPSPLSPRSPDDESAPAVEERALETDRPIVIFLGDSLAAGLELPKDEAFPSVLSRSLADLDLPFRLINAGVSGDTTRGGLRRLDWLLKQNPEILVVELGGNDGLRGVDLDEIETNLRGIVEQACESGTEVLLLGVQLPPNYGEDYTRGFAEIYPRLARDFDVAFVPFFMEGVGGVPDLNLPDGLHPNREGHRRLAENILPTLRQLLEKVTP